MFLASVEKWRYKHCLKESWKELNPIPSGKLRRHTPSFGCILAVRPKKYFFRNKTFLFFKIESWNFQVQCEIRETSQNFNSFSLFRQLLFLSFFIGCLIELKFCEVSQYSISNWTWKFQLSILKNKKVLFQKKYILWAVPSRYIQKMACAVSIFQRVLLSSVWFTL